MTDLRSALHGFLSDPRPDPSLGPGTPAAVMVPVLDLEEPSIMFTRRTDLVRDHKGEISFPGGARHAEDHDLLATALRETEEELGIRAGAFDVVGGLPPTPTIVSGFVIAPFVGLLAAPPALRPSEEEIAEVLDLPIRTLRHVEREVPAPGGLHPTMYSYEVDGSLVWGATGRILHSFLEILDKGGWA
ncbi:MAG TPA: CoA pyrophosphatase [Actinomycetota bacterium]